MRCEAAALYFEQLTVEELRLTHGLPDEVVEHLGNCLACQPKCYEVLRLIEAWFADVLPVGAMEHIRYHVSHCGNCAQAYATLAEVGQLRLVELVREVRFPVAPRKPNVYGYGALGPIIQ